MALSLLFFWRNSIPHSIFFVQVTLSNFTKLKIINRRYVITLLLPTIFFVPKKKTKKRFLIAKLLRIYYVRRLSVSYRMNVEDITKNAWRTPLNAQCNIEYRLQHSLFFTFLNYHRNRLFLYFLVNYRISITVFLYFFGYRFSTLATSRYSNFKSQFQFAFKVETLDKEKSETSGLYSNSLCMVDSYCFFYNRLPRRRSLCPELLLLDELHSFG